MLALRAGRVCKAWLRLPAAIVTVVAVVAGMGMTALAPSAAASVTGRVITTNGDVLHIRAIPTINGTVLGVLAQGSVISFSCFVYGDADTGPYGTETIWDHVDGTNGYVPDAWIYTGSNNAVVPQCASAPTPPPPPPTSSGNRYRIAWTGGIGVYPRTSTSMTATKVSPALAEGAWVTLACETTGQTVTDTAGYTSNLWDQLDSGYWVSNAYINTGTNGRTPGVPACGSTGGGSGGVPAPLPASHQYNRDVAATWAFNNAYAHPRFADDCTWFVSQALWKGGMKKDAVWTDDTLVDSAQPNLAKYHIYAPSRTAAQANALVNYLVSHHFAVKRKITWSDNTAAGAQKGDLLAYDWDNGSNGTIDHLAMVTGFKGAYPLRSQHSNGRQNIGWSWDPGDPSTHSPSGWIENTHPGSTAWLIHIVY